MADVRQIPVDEYESMKKSYGLTDEQMKSVVGVEPILTRWADGAGVGETNSKEESVKSRYKELADEINNILKKEKTTSVEEEQVKKEQVEEKQNVSNDVPLSESSETIEKKEEVSFEMPVFTESVKNDDDLAKDISFDIPVKEVQQKPEQEFSFDVPSFEMPVEDKSEAVETPAFNMEEVNSGETPSFESVDEVKETVETPAFNMGEVNLGETPSFESVDEVKETIETPVFNMGEVNSSETPSFESVDEVKETVETPAFNMGEEVLSVNKEENISLNEENIENLSTEVANNTTFSYDEMFLKGVEKLKTMIKLDRLQEQSLVKQNDLSK